MLGSLAGTMRRPKDRQRMIIMASFDGDLVDISPGEFAVEEIRLRVFFEVEAGDEAIEEAVAVGEMPVEFIDVVEDGGELSIDSDVGIEGIGDLGKGRHFFHSVYGF